MENMVLPVNYVYRSSTAEKNRFIITAGPYVSLIANALNTTIITPVNYESGPTVTLIDVSRLKNPISHTYQAGNPGKFDWSATGFSANGPCGITFVKVDGELGWRDVQRNVNDGRFNNRNSNSLLTNGYLIGNNR